MNPPRSPDTADSPKVMYVPYNENRRVTITTIVEPKLLPRGGID